MAIAELISVEQCLNTSFEHDAEFVEGRIVERPLPIWEHARLQVYLAHALLLLEKSLGIFTLSEQRVPTRPDRFRVPDICVATERPAGRGIVTAPPHLCIEILSPEDRAVDIQEKLREFPALGVEWVWVIDPSTCTGQIHTRAGVSRVEDGVFSTDLFEIDLSAAEL